MCIKYISNLHDRRTKHGDRMFPIGLIRQSLKPDYKKKKKKMLEVGVYGHVKKKGSFN